LRYADAGSDSSVKVQVIIADDQTGVFITVIGNIAAAIVFFLFSFFTPESFRFWFRIAALILVLAAIAMLLFWLRLRQKFKV